MQSSCPVCRVAELRSFGSIHRVKKKLVIFTLVVVVVAGAALLASRPPGKWSDVASGMTRPNVYSLLGEPDSNNEGTKGGVRWRSDALIGRWEFDVFFRADDTVGGLGKRWRWNWW